MPDCNRLAGGDAGTRHGSGRRDTSRTAGSDFSLNKEVKVFQFGARPVGPPNAVFMGISGDVSHEETHHSFVRGVMW